MSSFSRNNQDILEAAKNGHVDIIKALLFAGVDINIIDDSGRTALSWVSEKGYTDIVRILLDNGANPNIKDIYGWTPANWAIQNSHFKIVRLLKRTRSKNRKNKYPLLSIKKFKHL